ncbi:MAG: diguanylate cyclase (GGDEF)-like protein/PAS domain S-box-containing protein [Candidatus Paceibacteria bacterium]|jgi:diguanylate cyclase (GGDEF)-like protein/PAS domain S-box-containing protein
MQAPALPENEVERLAALARYAIVDSAEEGEFDDFTQLATHICGVPIALISLVDASRQWFKSHVGLDVVETDRTLSFCGHAILADGLFEVPDAARDARFQDNPLVTDGPQLRYYAGEPLVTDDGFRIGTLCVMDQIPRSLSVSQRAAMAALGRSVMRQIESRRTSRLLDEKSRFQEAVLDSADIALISTGPDGAISSFNRGAQVMLGYPAEAMPGRAIADLFAMPLPAVVGAADYAHQMLVLAGQSDNGFDGCQLQRSDGTPVPVHLSVTAVRDRDGHLLGALHLAQDISKRRQAQAAQRRATDMLQKIAMRVPGVICQFRRNSDGTYAVPYASEQLVQIYRVSPQQAVSDASLLIETIHPDDRQQVMASIERSAAELSPWRKEYRLLFDDGATCWVDGNGVPEAADDGGVLWHAVITDITGRKDAELELMRSHAILETLNEQLRAKQAELAAVSDASPLGLFRTDAAGGCTYINKAYETLTGLTLASARSDGWTAALHPEDRTAVMAAWDQAVRCASRYEQDQRLVHADGVEVITRVVAVPMLVDGVCTGFVGTADDITLRRRNTEALRDSEKRLRTITDNLPVLIAYIDKQLRLQFANATIESWLHVTPADAQGRRFEDIVEPGTYAQRLPYLLRALAGERVEFEMLVTNAGVAHHIQTTYVPDQDSDGNVHGVYALSSDISALKQTQLQLQALARYDTLTGLPNRYHLNQTLTEAVARGQRSIDHLAVLFLDIDHFKQINDTWGHAAGDAVLVEFGNRLKTVVRATDTVARLSGDEFIVLLEGLKLIEQAHEMARKILAALIAPFAWSGLSITVSASIGIAYGYTKNLTPTDLLGLADKALYRAKQAGRNVAREGGE